MKVNKFLVLVFLILNLMTYIKAATPAKKTYTEEEFLKEVSKEVEKRLKKIDGSNLANYSKELLEKEEKIKIQEINLIKKEEELNNNTNDLKKRITEFQESQKKILGCIDEQDKKVDKRVNQLVEVISGMKPQNAADILSVQDPDLSVRILGLLDSAKASKIFNLMDKQISAKLQKQFMDMKK